MEGIFKKKRGTALIDTKNNRGKCCRTVCLDSSLSSLLYEQECDGEMNSEREREREMERCVMEECF